MRTERTTSTGYKHMVTCFLCQREFQFGPHVYRGKGIAAWKVSVCDSCYRTNDDGIVLDSHTRLRSHLADLNVPITLNARGWLDWPE